MSENISVSVRIRPLNQRERESDQKEAWRVLQGINIVPSENNPRPGTQPFAFDNVFDGPCETTAVYDRCAKSIMSSALEGQNGTIFVYGQTSSGKTHTMQGNEESPGIVPLGISYIFDEIKRRAANVDFLVRCSYVEIYNENITDLLNPKNGSLKLCTNAKGGCFVGGVTEPVIANAAQATELITKGMANRSVGETKMNSESSRSHSLLRMVIESRDKSDVSGAVRIAELNLVDLAGSERQSHTQATGTRLKEGANINKSLLTLSNVIAKLSEGAQGQHIPYRDSKLTRVLERALGGNSRTSIICTVTNAAVHAEETLSTLKFATRAKTIKNTAEVNEVLDDQAMLRKYKKEIDQLKKKLRYTSAGGEKDMEICQMINQLQSLQDENADLKSEKQELIAAQAEKEHKMSKLTDLVITAGANMSMEEAALAHARKAKATSRQSWCPGALPAGAGFAGFGAFPSKAPTNKLALASGIEEGDESSTDWDGDESEKRKSSDSSMSLCSASGDAAAAAAAAAAEIERLNGEKLQLASKLAEAEAEVAASQLLLEESAARVAALEAAAEESQQMLQQAAAGGEAALTALSQELEQTKAQKLALAQEVEELQNADVASRLELAQAQSLLQEAQEAAAKSAKETEALRAEMAAAAAAAARELEAGKVALGKAQEAAAKAAEESGDAHAAVVQGLKDMLAQSEADYAQLKGGKEALETQLAEAQREIEALKEAATEAEFQSERERNRMEEAVEKGAGDLARLQTEQEQLMGKVVDLEEELDTVKNERQELVLQVQELQDDNDELNALVKKQSGVGNKRMSVYGGGVKNEGSFDARRQSMASSRMSIAPGGGMGPSSGGADAAQLRREMGVKEQRCTDLEKAKDKLERANEALKLELSTLKEELGGAKKELKKNASKGTSLERAKEESEREMEKLRNKLAAAEEKIKTLGQERSQLAADKSSGERELRMANAKVEALDKEAEKLRATNLKMKETQSALAAAEKKAAASAGEEQRLVAELEVTSKELARTQQDLLACADERDVLAQQHEEVVATHAKTVVELQDVSGQQAELEKLCEDMNLQIKALEAQVVEGKAERAALESERDEAGAMVEALKEQVKGKDDTLAANQKSIAILQQDLEEAEKQVDLMTQRIDSTKSEMARLHRIEATNGDLQDAITALRAEQQASQDALADAKFEIQQLQTDAAGSAAEHEAAVGRLQGLLEGSREQIATLEEDKERLRRQFIDFSDTKDLIAASEGLEKRIFELETALSAEQHTVKKCEGELQHVQEEKAALEVLAEELKALKREHAVGLKDLEEAKAALVKQEEAANKLAASLESRLASAMEQVSDLKCELASTKEENKLQMQEVCQLRAVNEATKKEIDRCIAEQTLGGDRMLERIKELSSKSEKAEVQAEKLKDTVEALQSDKSELQRKLQLAEADLALVKEAALKMEAALEAKSAEMAGALDNKKSLEAQLAEVKAAAADLRAEAKESSSKLSQLEKEHSKCEDIPTLKETAAAATQRVQEKELEVAKLTSKCELLEQDRANTQRMLETQDSSGAKVAATVSKLSDELQEARARAATLQLSLDQALLKVAEKEQIIDALQAAGAEMEAALTAKLAEMAEIQGRLDAALQEKDVQASLAEVNAAGAKEEREALAKDLAAAQQEAAELRSKSGNEANVIIEACEKRMKILEYDLIAKAEEQKRLEKVRDEAFHKMTLMKAEYTGRVKRREEKIAELEARLSRLGGAGSVASLASSNGVDSTRDKENDIELLQTAKENAGNVPASKAAGGKTSKSVKMIDADTPDAADGSKLKRSTRSSAKALTAL